MSNEEWELKKFIIQHPEYTREYEANNLAVNLFSDILRKNPREAIAVSDLPHNLDLIGTRLAKKWEIRDARAEREPRKPFDRNIGERAKIRNNEQTI